MSATVISWTSTYPPFNTFKNKILSQKLLTNTFLNCHNFKMTLFSFKTLIYRVSVEQDFNRYGLTYLKRCQLDRLDKYL